jgi:hypothetical protein
MSLADQIRRAVEPRVINRDHLLQLAREVERMEEQHAALVAAWDEIQAAGAKPAPIGDRAAAVVAYAAARPDGVTLREIARDIPSVAECSPERRRQIIGQLVEQGHLRYGGETVHGKPRLDSPKIYATAGGDS